MNLSRYIAEAQVPIDKDPKGQYARVVIKLDDPNMIGTDIEIYIAGNYIAKISCTGSKNYFKFDRRHNAPIYVDEFKEAYKEFDTIYLTNTESQSGKTLVLQIGRNAEIVPEIEESFLLADRLYVSADAGTDTIATPGLGYALEVTGYNITETEEADMVIAAEAKLRFEPTTYLWTGILAAEGAVRNYRSEVGGLKVRGKENQALLLENADITAGSSQVSAVIYYRIVGV